jgi:hypothetical protein
MQTILMSAVHSEAILVLPKAGNLKQNPDTRTNKRPHRPHKMKKVNGKKLNFVCNNSPLSFIRTTGIHHSGLVEN